ncbi:MAG: prepilin-type N-terminal cleavage/methylation domain-containing protein, partial [Pseudorhodobacter sp.]|nr:prepilin-type N-terminal cleavage/methylation domain-containing protein [Pseudorhodobacter sp.]
MSPGSGRIGDRRWQGGHQGRGGRNMTRSRTAGVTLIEVLVSLAIFAVIGVAG